MTTTKKELKDLIINFNKENNNNFKIYYSEKTKWIFLTKSEKVLIMTSLEITRSKDYAKKEINQIIKDSKKYVDLNVNTNQFWKLDLEEDQINIF